MPIPPPPPLPKNVFPLNPLPKGGWQAPYSLAADASPALPPTSTKCPSRQPRCPTNSSPQIFSTPFSGSFSANSLLFLFSMLQLCASSQAQLKCYPLHTPCPNPHSQLVNSHCSVDTDLCYQCMHSNNRVTPYTVVICVHIYVPLSQGSCFCFTLLILVFPISKHRAFDSFFTGYSLSTLLWARPCSRQ